MTKKKRLRILKVKEKMTEEEGDDNSGKYMRSQDTLLDVIKLFMEQQTKQL